jgi:hypothetical protein
MAGLTGTSTYVALLTAGVLAACGGSSSNTSDAGADGRTDSSGSGSSSDSASDSRSRSGSDSGSDSHSGSGPDSGSTDGGSGPSTMRVGTNLWNLGWGIYDNVFSISGDSSTWSALTPPFNGKTGKASVPWNPTFLQEMAHYDTIRSMDLVATNADTNADWSTRIAPTVSPLDGTANPNGILAWEWIIDLANRAGMNLWLNIPVDANATYLTSLANLVFTNLQARSGLTVYIEWGNEDWWEPIPNAQAKSLGAGDATKGTVIGSTTMFEAFQAALTASGRKDIRLVRVLGGQSVNTYLTGQLLADLPSGGADAFAIAPYVGSAATVTSSDFASEYAAVVAQVAAQYALTQKAGLSLVGYEGGQNSSSETSAITDDPSYYVPYGQFLQGLGQYFTIFNHYMHCNGGTTGGWAAEESVGDVSSSSKAFRVHALFDWSSGYIPSTGTVPTSPAAYADVKLPVVSY